MRLSTKGRYAVMAMADLAQHEAANKPVSLADIAQRQEISLSYLEQLFAKLRRSGLVKSVLSEAVIAAVLVSIMVLAFLGSWRSVLIVCSSIRSARSCRRNG